MDYQRYADEHHMEIAIEDRVATITLNRPDVRNAINFAMHTGLENIWREIGRDPDVGAVLLTGAGKAFCAGGDLKGFGGPDDGPLDQLRGTRWLVQEMVNCEAPVIAAVNGSAMGLGATIALLSDVIFMADTARIGDTHVKIGLVAGDGGAVIWPILIGPHRAKEMLMSGILVDGVKAGEMGLVNHCVPHEKLLDEAREHALSLAHGPQVAIRWTKMAINQTLKQSIHHILDFSAAAEHLSVNTEDMREASLAFREKRTPKFKGR